MSPIRNYTIEYSLICSIGKVRRNNEDNFYADGHIREDVDSLEESVLSGKVSASDNECFAVFDGMGGEALGEVASFVAASHTLDFLADKNEFDEYIYELSAMLNQKVCDETKARSLVLMGTTAAMVQFYKDTVYVLNAGDSRVYRLSGHTLQRISKDHIAYGYGKAITKFLGMPDDEEPLSPYIAECKYQSKDIYLLCSDGVSDMLTDDEIEEILDQKSPVDTLCRELVDAALRKGGIDNTTAIICKIS